MERQEKGTTGNIRYDSLLSQYSLGFSHDEVRVVVLREGLAVHLLLCPAVIVSCANGDCPAGVQGSIS
eukprot:48844-Eustigmatos_ZCMA.PRE.1